jgi:hypothetical protein
MAAWSEPNGDVLRDAGVANTLQPSISKQPIA